MPARHLVATLIAACLLSTGTTSVAADETTGTTTVAKTSSLTLGGAPFRSAIKAVCESYGVEYRIADNVTGGSVSLNLHGDTLDQALVKLSGSSGVAYSIENGVYCFAMPGGAANAPSGSQPPVPTAETAKAGIYRGNFRRTGVYATKGVNKVITAERILGASTDEIVQCSPVVVGGVVYVCLRDKTLRAMDVATGTEIWRYQARDRLWSPPAVVDGVVYLPSKDKYLYAIDGTSGTLRWKFRAIESISSSPAVSKGTVYFGDIKGRLYALDAVTGVRKWDVETKCTELGSPALDGDLIYIDGRGAIVAVDMGTQQVKWRWRAKGDGLCETPVVAGNLVVFVTYEYNQWLERVHGLRAVDAQTGSDRWQLAGVRRTPRFIGSPAVENGVVYCATLDGVYAVGLADGQEKWHYDAKTPRWNVLRLVPDERYRWPDTSLWCLWCPFSPTVADGMVYCGDNKGNVFAVDAQTGQQRWKHKVEGLMYTAPVVADGRLYFATFDVSGLQVLR